MHVIDYITPDGCGHIILAATEADAAKGMGKAFAATGMPPELEADAGPLVSLYIKARGRAAMEIQGITLSPISQETFESLSRALFPSQQQ